MKKILMAITLTAIAAMKEDIDSDIMAVKAGLGEDVTTYRCMGGECYETFVDKHTTKHGDTVVAFGYYGHEG